MIKKLALVLASMALVASVHASNLAADNASDSAYTPGNDFNGQNGGFGFLAWQNNYLNPGGGFSGAYVGVTADGNPAFGLFASANGDFNGNVQITADSTALAVRPFTGALALTPGEAFSITLGSTTIAKGAVGINLIDSSNNTVFTLVGVAGIADWQLNDGGSNLDTGIAYNPNTPEAFTFIYNGGASYSYTLGGASGNNTASDTISDIRGVKLFASGIGANQNAGFNNLSITLVPEPSTLSLLAGPALLGGWFLIRQRRRS